MWTTIFNRRLAQIARCNFLRQEDGTIAIETMIILPMLFWTYLTMFSIFDSFETYSNNQKAAYTIGDAISRETLPIDDAYLNGTQDLFEYLTWSEGQSSIRVSSLWYDEASDSIKRDWSQSRGWVVALTDSDVVNWKNRLPVMPDGERVVVVETWSNYTPPFKTGLEKGEIHNFVFTRPRYAPRVCWVSCD
ncbi:hypothetical protein SAMN04488523_10193 [Sulfitobacter brevis]|uniref:TadE-like protein n=1 Tax=Sulfitobacter brevis TaxID=74348 RepID=A0A1I1SMM1_9RHOB|nr:hypothetical protein [Sulfitobacter brevis]SFD47696.1 hypothetical protein SAMN04488523_10193 [Sulfitobacter brevis]